MLKLGEIRVLEPNKISSFKLMEVECLHVIELLTKKLNAELVLCAYARIN